MRYDETHNYLRLKKRIEEEIGAPLTPEDEVCLKVALLVAESIPEEEEE